jgi:hypothetical protein
MSFSAEHRDLLTAKESWEPPAANHLASPGPINHYVPTGAAEPFRIGKTNHHEINANAEGADGLSAGRPPTRLLLRGQLGLAENHRQIQIRLKLGLA